jgi:hypothetical protein
MLLRVVHKVHLNALFNNQALKGRTFRDTIKKKFLFVKKSNLQWVMLCNAQFIIFLGNRCHQTFKRR